MVDKKLDYNFRVRSEIIFSETLDKLIKNSPRVRESHNSNEMHRYKSEMMYLIKDRGYSAMNARNIVSKFISKNGFLPMKI
jgi:hypothetical protein